MTEQRRVPETHSTSAKAAGPRELDALRASDAPLSEFVKAGGLRRFSTEQMFSHKTLIEGSIRGAYLQAACTCGWRGVKREKYGTAKNAAGRTVTAFDAGTEQCSTEIAAHLAEVHA